MKKILYLFFLLLLLTGCDNNSTDKELASIERQVRNDAIKKFQEQSFFNLNKIDPESAQGFFDVIAGGGKGWKLSDEESKYEETHYFKFPLTAVRTTIISNPNKPNEFVSNEQLFIYSFDNSEWFPISVRKIHVKDGEIIKSSTENLWDEMNDWAEVYKKY